MKNPKLPAVMPNTEQPGARAAEWQHWQMLGLTEDLLPVVSHPHATISPNSDMKTLGKTPSLYNRDGQVVGIRKWTQKRSTDKEIGQWAQQPDYGLSIQTRHLRVFDIDIKDRKRSRVVVEMITAMLGPMPMRFREDSGKCALAFWLKGDYPKRKIQTAHGMIEFLANGQQFVAGGRHTDGARYEWGQEWEGDGSLPEAKDIPELTYDEVAGVWSALQATLGVEPERVTRGGLVRPVLDRNPSDVEDNIAHFLEGAGWVLSRAKDGTINIRCPFKHEHSVNSGETETRYFPAGVGKKPDGMPFARGHFKCMHAHCSGRQDSEFLEAIGYMDGEFEDLTGQDIVALDGSTAPPIVDLEKVSELPRLSSTNAPEQVPARHPTVTFLDPFPGAMAATVDAALLSAPKPQKALTVLAVLAGMAAACSGRYRLPSGMRLNLYCVGVAVTGAGKDFPRQVGIMVAKAAGAKTFGKPGSGQGLEDALEPSVGMLCEVDEIAHMLAAANGPKTPAYLIELAGNLLKLFSAGSNDYHTRVLARSKGSLPSRVVPNPCLSLLGFATPHTLGTAVSSANVADGLLGRFLFAFGADDVKPRRSLKRFVLPEVVAAAGERIRQALVALEFGKEGMCIEIVISPEAECRLAELIESLDRRAQGGSTAFEQALRARSFEKLERIAGVLAVWENPSGPTMQIEHVDWALKLVDASDAAAIRFTTDHMHDGEVQAHAAKVLDTVRRILRGDLKADRESERAAVQRGYAPRSLVLRRSGLAKDQLDKAVAHLQATSDIRVVRSISAADKGGERDSLVYQLRDAE